MIKSLKIKLIAFTGGTLFILSILIVGLLSEKAVAQPPVLDEQAATIMSINKTMPAVVSIIVYDNINAVNFNFKTGEQNVVKQKEQKGSGTGFIISRDGLILTNKHVVSVVNEKTAEYRIIMNSGKQYYAQLIGKDPLNDLAILKIFDKNLPFVAIGDSDKLQIGTSVVAIGNSLGRYQNSATKGIVSGLGRSLVASDQSGTTVESLDNVIQTDADINLGNSGGPLIDLEGRVIGVNVAVDQAGSGLSFAIPINDVKTVIRSAVENGRIVRPRVGLRYIMLSPEVAQDKGLTRNSGALVTKDQTGNPAIMPGSPAEKADIQEGDIIFEINGVKLEDKNTLLSVVQRYRPGNKIGFKILRGEKVIIRFIVLDEFK